MFFVLYLLVLILSKTVFSQYDTAKFRVINYHFLDLLLMIGFMTIYFPQILPPNFTADYGDDEQQEETGEIYHVSLGNIYDFIKNDIKYYNNTNISRKNLEKSVSNRYPILIINPFHVDNTDTYNTIMNKVMETSNIGEVNNN